MPVKYRYTLSGDRSYTSISTFRPGVTINAMFDLVLMNIEHRLKGLAVDREELPEGTKLESIEFFEVDS